MRLLRTAPFTEGKTNTQCNKAPLRRPNMEITIDTLLKKSEKPVGTLQTSRNASLTGTGGSRAL
jgi:hypothetical protein